MNEGNYRRSPSARPHDAAWRDFALCAETDPDAFFPEKGQSPGPARKVCAQCFVRRECLGYAMADTSLQGVWGGLTEQERRALRRGRGAAALAVVTEKTCTGCGITKPLGEFHRTTDNSTGRAGRCKACRHEVSKQRWREKAA